MASLRRPIRLLLAAAGLLLLGSLAGVLVLSAVPRYRWRVQLVRLKAAGGLPDISWKELRSLNRHGDPFHLQGLLEIPNPYVTIKNPFESVEDVSAGEKIFESHCELCHGAGGQGGPAGPALEDRQMQKGSSDWAIFKTISNGIPGTSMPGSGGSLSPEDRWRLVAFIRLLAHGGEIHTELPFGISQVAPVRYEDILADKQDIHRWLTYSGSYDGQRFSPDDRINRKNVSSLHLLWIRQYATEELSIETTPLVVDGFMFVTAPPNQVEALDAKTGTPIWRYERTLPEHLSLCCGYVNRGLAVLGHTLFLGTLDAHLVALDMRSGRVIWDVEIADYKSGYSITGAPLALKNMVVTGVAGGEYGIRGFLTARDVDTGKEIWRFDTVPKPGQPGSETWSAAALNTGGAPTWLTGTFDPQLNLLYWPVGNPSPNYNGQTREGDNLYSNSVVALDPDRGTLRWSFQFTPHDLFDWDSTETLVSFDADIGGQHQRLLGQADRNAFYYLLNRETGQFLSAHAFSKQNWAKEIDSHGRPVRNPAAMPTKEGTTIYPAVGGATNWWAPSFSPITSLLYVPVMDWHGIFYLKSDEYKRGETFTGGYSQTIINPLPKAVVRALDAVTGEIRWEYPTSAFNVGGVLSTKGGVVFGGAGTFFFALDAGTGRELWRVNTGGMVKAAPVTYSVGDRQYVTVAVGHDLLTFGL